MSSSLEFSWGPKEHLGAKNLNSQYYKSFTYDGVEYFLFDSVYMWVAGQPGPHIGKLIRIYETSRLEKKVKVVWFFRPPEVQKWLNDASVLNNELFLGSGEGIGLCNVNELEAISGKCNVLCTAKDERNPKASAEELKKSDYVFSRVFDVGKCRLSERFPNQIAGVDVRRFFNPKPKVNTAVTAKPFTSSKLEAVTTVKTVTTSNLVKDKDSVSGKLKNNIAWKYPAANAGIPTYCGSDSHDAKKRKVQEIEVDKKKSVEPDNRSKRPKLDTSYWFKKLPWEERMHKAQEIGSLVLLDNLYPSFTSSEVEDIVMDAFKTRASAKMIQGNAYSSPYNGQALVIFKSKDEADFAISELNTKCLMIGGVRPVGGRRPSLKEPGSHPSKHFGHITVKPKQNQWNNAVSTSHYSQTNTVEFNLALEWQTQQKEWELCWKKLHKEQEEEMSNLKNRLKPASRVMQQYSARSLAFSKKEPECAGLGK